MSTRIILAAQQTEVKLGYLTQELLTCSSGYGWLYSRWISNKDKRRPYEIRISFYRLGVQVKASLDGSARPPVRSTTSLLF
jgi:hypothetical protein